MSLWVLKFGGTSLKTRQDREQVARLVGRRASAGEQLVVVVSAIGRRGDPYATDSLLGLLEGLPAVAPAERDLLLACGEVIAAVVMVAHLRTQALPALALTGGQAGILTDDRFGDARILSVDPGPLRRHLQAGALPVVAGFQGRTADGRVTTLGRGGSDTTAVALGAALGADGVDIYTDVDGVYTADPRLVPDARAIAEMDYDEVFQLANLGARVLHPRAVEIARQFGVAVRVRSTFSDHDGTRIGPPRQPLDLWSGREPRRAVTGITHMTGLTRFRVEAPPQAPGWSRELFRRLGEEGVSVDLINLFPDRAWFSVPTDRQDDARRVLEALGYAFAMEPGRAKVSVVGSAIRGLPGVVGAVMEGLHRVGVEVLQTVDSHSTITLLVDQADVAKAVRGLHDQFELGLAPP